MACLGECCYGVAFPWMHVLLDCSSSMRPVSTRRHHRPSRRNGVGPSSPDHAKPDHANWIGATSLRIVPLLLATGARTRCWPIPPFVGRPGQPIGLPVSLELLWSRGFVNPGRALSGPLAGSVSLEAAAGWPFLVGCGAVWAVRRSPVSAGPRPCVAGPVHPPVRFVTVSGRVSPVDLRGCRVPGGPGCADPGSVGPVPVSVWRRPRPAPCR